MKGFEHVTDAQAKRKSLKPLVERRRRDRINRSLDALKSLLLHAQGESPRRVDKAEILERTVLFLHRTSAGGEAHKRSFHDGVSACLHRAAQVLQGPEGKDLRLGAALEARVAARLAGPQSESAGGQRGTAVCWSSSSLLLRQSCRAFLHKSGSRCSTAGPNAAGRVRTCGGSSRSLTSSEQLHKAASGASEPSPAQSHPVIQCVWRPWF